MRKQLKFYLAAALATAACVWLSAAAPEKGDQQQTTVVQTGLLRIVIPVSGIVVPSAEIPVQARMAGEIISAPVDIGQSVKKGQRLVELDPAPTSRALALALAELRECEALLQTARLQLAECEQEQQRAAGERGRKSIPSFSTYTLELRRCEVAAREAALAKAQLAVEAARADFNRLVIVAPTSGVITECTIRRSQVISAGMVESGQPILTLSDLSKIAVLVEVDEAYLPEIQPNLAATVTFPAFPEKRFQGRVASILPKGVNRAGKTCFMVRINVDGNPGEAARPGLTALAHIVAIEKSNALLLDVKAIRWVNAEPRVVVLEQNQPKERTIRIGRSDGARCEVLEGLRQGDVVVLPPAPPPAPAPSVPPK
ncbi:MAG: efflux RND transporter periplasmic adaptor subunit [Candidatus Sumerlaeia bacterium]|nr:efflux RND transporter periplasmic adaptor subunit [Candidatus Sumerlaeia bacterium]